MSEKNLLCIVCCNTMHNIIKFSLCSNILTSSPSQVIRRLTFLTSSLTTRLIQKIYGNIQVILEELLLINQATTKEVIFCTNF